MTFYFTLQPPNLDDEVGEVIAINPRIIQIGIEEMKVN